MTNQSKATVKLLMEKRTSYRVFTQEEKGEIISACHHHFNAITNRAPLQVTK